MDAAPCEHVCALATADFAGAVSQCVKIADGVNRELVPAMMKCYAYESYDMIKGKNKKCTRFFNHTPTEGNLIISSSIGVACVLFTKKEEKSG